MKRLRIFDLSFCENEVSDLSQVQGGQLVVGLAVSLNVANSISFSPNSFSVVRTGLTSADILVSGVGSSATGAAGGAAAGAAAAGGGAIIGVFASTSAKAS